MTKLENKKYTFWELLEKVGIKIPIIQRDYAQGRQNKQAQDIRENFLNSLLEILNSENKTIDLDFVYGTVKDGYLILLDGQQRLTTLFLLHYFLALKDKKLNKNIRKILIKFTYETRLSSREFINLLINRAINLNEEKISTTIKNQTWFFSDWENNPTITSMLTMLDSMQDKFKNENGLFEKLISKKQKQITFSFLPLDEFKLTDELYIKMNARGKPLTEFENFKSNFEKFLVFEEKELENQTKANLDNEWHDIFWKFEKEKDEDKENPAQKADELFLNFFKNITAFYSEEFSKVDIFKFDYTDRIDDICKILDSLKNYEDSQTDGIRKNLKLFEYFLKEEKDISYADRVKFYILMVFFLKKGLPSEYPTIFKSWIRVNINIIHNTAYDNIKDFKKSIKFIDILGEHIDNLYDFLSKYNSTDKISNQLKEEIEKATIIKAENIWEKYFLKAERHSYLDGEIKFLIDISKKDEKISEEKFKKYRIKFKILWKFVSDKKDKKENEMLLHRALLTFGEYLPKQKNSNKYTFGSFGFGLREKNENWRRIFKKEEFQKLLDKLTCDDTTQELRNIIDSFKFDCNDWRSYFINPNKKWTPISYANYYHIKIDNNAIFLNNGWSSSKATGWGWSRVYEMYSIYLLQYIQDKLNSIEHFLGIYPYPSSDINEAYPCIVIKNLKIKDTYSFEIKIKYVEKYIIEFFEKNNKQIPNKIMEILKSIDKDNEIYDITVYKNEQFKLCEQNDLITFLTKLLEKFREII